MKRLKRLIAIFLVTACSNHTAWAQAVTGGGFIPYENGTNLSESLAGKTVIQPKVASGTVVKNCPECSALIGEYSLATSTVTPPPGNDWRFSKGRLSVSQLDGQHLLFVMACEWQDSPKSACDEWWTAQIREDGVYLSDHRAGLISGVQFDRVNGKLRILSRSAYGSVRTDQFVSDSTPLSDRALIRRRKNGHLSFNETVKEKAFGHYSKWRYSPLRVEFK
jgi:hypothetical protein